MYFFKKNIFEDRKTKLNFVFRIFFKNLINKKIYKYIRKIISVDSQEDNERCSVDR